MSAESSRYTSSLRIEDYDQRYVHTISHKAIFEQLIHDEVRQGRLSPYRRKRIVRYAANLGLTAVEIGQMIDQCKQKVSHQKPTQLPNLILKEVPTESNHTTRGIWFMRMMGVGMILVIVAYVVTG